jgi:putative flavoprotein involved in K+ transport
MGMAERVDTIVIGAGQAGLAVSYYLTQQGRQHLVLERDRVGEAWRSKKWDSFTLVTPNWAVKLPGFAYQGDDPDGYLTHEEVVHYLEEYAAIFNPPLRLGVTVTSLQEAADGFVVESNAGSFTAANVVVATGAFQKPKIPAFSALLSPHIRQLHSSEYRNSSELPPGAILVVGSGQSGGQITEELYQEGRKVYLSTGGAGRMPRRYRGKDIFWWINEIGMMDRTVDRLPSPEKRFDANPQLTGKGGGRWLDLHQFYLDGVTLLGRMKDGKGTRLFFAEDLMENLAKSDKPIGEVKKAIDGYIDKNSLEIVQEESLPALRAGYDSPIITELDLDEAGIASIIWACGYAFDFSWVKLPIFDEFGYPIQERGITAQPGLYFVGLQWLFKPKSSLLLGVGEDAEYITTHIAAR